MGQAGAAQQGLEEVRKRIEDRVGKVPVTGRYHKFPRKIEDDYVLAKEVLGSGYSGSIILARDRQSQSRYAVKRFNLANMSQGSRTELVTECEILLSLDHPHIVRLVDVYETPEQLSLVMECMDGGELFQRIKSKKRFSEEESAQTAFQMLLAVNYMHNQNIVHRDLKLENFMYESKASNHLKLIDFGFSKICKPNAEMTESLGTVAYCAPEVFKRNYTLQCDLWSLGVIVFILLSGYMPFAGEEIDMMRLIKKGKYKMKQDKWDKVSEEAFKFTRELLQVDPQRRLTAEQALQHDWIQKYNSIQTRQEHIDATIVEGLTKFARMSSFRRACMSVVGWCVSGEVEAKARDVFLELDQNHDGTISPREFKKALQDMHVADDAIDTAFAALDVNHTNEIDYAEFLSAMAMVPSCIELNDVILQQTFRRFDTDSSGYITEANLQEVLGDKFEGKKVSKLLIESGTTNNGAISFREFIQYMGNESPKKRRPSQRMPIAVDPDPISPDDISIDKSSSLAKAMRTSNPEQPPCAPCSIQ